MGSKRGRSLAPEPLEEQVLPGAVARTLAGRVAVARMPGKGKGLRAKRALRKHSVVGVYAGRVYSNAQHKKLVRGGATTGKYAVDYFHRRKGVLRDGYVLEPGAKDALHPRFANAAAAYINEPGPNERANAVWVRNYGTPRGRMELRAARGIRKGEELTACYGPGYPRTYRTSCTVKPGYLYYVSKAQRTPKML